MEHDEADEIIYPEGRPFLIFISDNIDQTFTKVDNNNIYHGLGAR